MQAGRREWAWVLDGQLVTLAVLEDRAEGYEKLRHRFTPRGPETARRALRFPVWLRAFTGCLVR